MRVNQCLCMRRDGGNLEVGLCIFADVTIQFGLLIPSIAFVNSTHIFECSMGDSYEGNVKTTAVD